MLVTGQLIVLWLAAHACLRLSHKMNSLRVKMFLSGPQFTDWLAHMICTPVCNDAGLISQKKLASTCGKAIQLEIVKIARRLDLKSAVFDAGRLLEALVVLSLLIPADV